MLLLVEEVEEHEGVYGRGESLEGRERTERSQIRSWIVRDLVERRTGCYRRGVEDVASDKFSGEGSRRTPEEVVAVVPER